MMLLLVLMHISLLFHYCYIMPYISDLSEPYLSLDLFVRNSFSYGHFVFKELINIIS